MEPNQYQQTLDYLYTRLPMFSRIGGAAIKKDLTNIRAFCDALKQPQEEFKSIHIAGTNGKGSTSHALSAVFQECGYKTGLYTSPHLVDFRERIRVNGKPVSEEWVVHFVEKHKALIEAIEPSFFEITVAMAFEAFREAGVDIAIIETGLGGRLDSTNIINPILSIITNISFDHKDLLGETLVEIAGEKAGIIKNKVPVLIGEQDDAINHVFFEKAMQMQSIVYYADSLWELVKIKQDNQHQYYKAVHKGHREMYDLATDLLGIYQTHNIKNVLAAVEIINSMDEFKLPLEKTLKALSRVKSISGLRGRWEVLQENPLIVADVAHNPAGLSNVMQQWQAAKGKQKHIVVGFVKDKDVKEALSFFPPDAIYYFTQADTPRALPAPELQEIADHLQLHGNAYLNIKSAVDAAMNNLHMEDALLITGSFFIVGDAIQEINKRKQAANQAQLF